MRSVEEFYRGSQVRVFRLDRERLRAALAERARELLRSDPEVLEVRLFGSLAQGGAAPGSDADVWVLLRDGAAPFLARTERLRRAFEGLGIACDVISHSESEWERLRQEGRRIVRAVLEEGLELANRRAR